MVPEETLERAAVDDVSPRYLRKQKTSDVKRRRVRQVGSLICRGGMIAALAIAAGGALGWAIHFLLFSPQMLLAWGQFQIRGTRYVSRGEVAAIFSGDMGRSVLRVPLDRRRAAIERLPWVKQATVERLLPDRLLVQVQERQPVAFLRSGSGMQWIDSDGFILGAQPGANLNLPVVSGLGASTPAAERARRVAVFLEFLKQIETVRAGAGASVSEADLSSASDVLVTLAGLPEFGGQGPVLAHFGNRDFGSRFQTVLEDFGGWRQKAGNIEAIDLRFDGQALVTPAEPLVPAPAQSSASGPPQAAPVNGAGAAAGRRGRTPAGL